MPYLIDANVLITAHTSYYPVDRVPEFWEWLHHMASKGAMQMPLEIFEEIKDGPQGGDLLFAWVQDLAHQKALVLDEEANADTVDLVVKKGYAADLTEDELEQLGRDPFLIAYAIDIDGTVVTAEASKPSRKRQNRHIPDVCKALGVKSCNPFEMYKTLGFSTDWKTKL